MSENVKEYLEPGQKNLFLIYILYLSGIILPILPIIGAVFAFAHQNEKNNFLKTHYVFAFRTFVFGMVCAFIAMVTTIIFIGPVLYIMIFVWFIIRSIYAVQYLLSNTPHPNPLSFWIK